MSRAWPLFCLIGVGACGPKPACRQIEDKGKSVASWAATAEMIAQRWDAGDIPAFYAHMTLAKGEQQIRSATMKLEQAQNGNAARVMAARARYRQLAATLSRLDAAIAKGDRSESAGLAARLPAIGKQLGALRDQCRAQDQARSGKRAS